MRSITRSRQRQDSTRAGKARASGAGCAASAMPAFSKPRAARPMKWRKWVVGEDGLIDLKVGTHSNGQGHETTYAQIAADALGLPLERFRFRQGDTDDLDSGGGHGGARSMHQGGTALLMAAEGLIENARRLAARLLQAVSGCDPLRSRHAARRRDRAGDQPGRGSARLLAIARRRYCAGSCAQGHASLRPLHLPQRLPCRRSRDRPRDR